MRNYTRAFPFYGFIHYDWRPFVLPETPTAWRPLITRLSYFSVNSASVNHFAYLLSI